MSQTITVRFDSPDEAIILWDIQGNWNMDDWNTAVQRSVELRASVKDRPLVPVILDLQYSGPLPVGLLAHARTGIDHMDSRDFVVVAGGSGFMRSFVEAFRLLNPSYRDKVFLADNRAEARTLIVARQNQD